MKRARWPAATEEAKAGGFLVGYMPSGSPIYRNPCTEQVLKLLDNLLALIRWVKLTWNNLCWLKNLWKPNCDKYMECSEHVLPVKPTGTQAGAGAQVLFLTVHSGEWHWGNWSLLNVHWPGLQESIKANWSLGWGCLPYLHCYESATQLIVSRLTSLLCPQPLQGHLSSHHQGSPSSHRNLFALFSLQC